MCETTTPCIKLIMYLIAKLLLLIAQANWYRWTHRRVWSTFNWFHSIDVRPIDFILFHGEGSERCSGMVKDGHFLLTVERAYGNGNAKLPPCIDSTAHWVLETAIGAAVFSTATENHGGQFSVHGVLFFCFLSFCFARFLDFGFGLRPWQRRST